MVIAQEENGIDERQDDNPITVEDGTITVSWTLDEMRQLALDFGADLSIDEIKTFLENSDDLAEAINSAGTTIISDSLREYCIDNDKGDIDIVD